jgi:hypothetical protein
MARCRARTEDGTGPLCRNRVSKAGERCRWHRGLPEAPPRKSKPRAAQSRTSSGTGPAKRKRRSTSAARTTASRSSPARTRTQIEAQRRRERAAAERAARKERRQRERIEKAAEYCADVVTEEWREAVASQATDYLVTPEAWDRLFRSRRRRHCTVLAQIAAQMLALKQKIHDLFGWLIALLVSVFGINDAEKTFVKELASRMPLPPDAKIIAVARGVQVTGILLCLGQGDELTRCQCFIDLALSESKTRVKKLLLAATEDWTGLSAFPPKTILAA